MFFLAKPEIKIQLWGLVVQVWFFKTLFRIDAWNHFFAWKKLLFSITFQDWFWKSLFLKNQTTLVNHSPKLILIFKFLKQKVSNFVKHSSSLKCQTWFNFSIFSKHSSSLISKFNFLQTKKLNAHFKLTHQPLRTLF